MKKAIISFVLIVGAIVVYALVRPPAADGPQDSPSPSPEASVTPAAAPKATVQPTVSRAAVPSGSPTPTLTPAPTQAARTPMVHQVSIEDFKYVPSAVTVTAGDTVIFTNRDSVMHTATSLTGAFDSGPLSSGASWTMETAGVTPGEYEYKCTPHPFMRGSVTVQ